MTQTAASAQNEQPIVTITHDQLPLSCPRPEDEVWNMHPRVYLPIEDSGDVTCPYCGARYRLEE